MSLTSLMNRTVTIVRRSPSGTFDDYGNEIDTVTETDTVGELQQQVRRGDSEPGGQGELSDQRWDLFLPAGTDITTGDAVIVDGLTYEMFGDPWPVRNPRTQEESHVQASLRRTAGSETGS